MQNCDIKIATVYNDETWKLFIVIDYTLLKYGTWASGCLQQLQLPKWSCPIGWGCRIRVSWIYDTKQSDGDTPVMLELWEM